MKDFELIPHTADLAVRVYGRTLPALFKNAGLALFSLISDYQAKVRLHKKIEIQADSLEELLVTWLNELISLFFTYKFFPKSYNIAITFKPILKLVAVLKGFEYDPYSKPIKAEVKAATYHNLTIVKDKRGYHTQIILDV